MASFRKRGPYQWQAQVRIKGYPLQTKTFETKAAAEAWARAPEHEMDQGVYFSRAEAEPPRSVTCSRNIAMILRRIKNALLRNRFE